MLLVGDDEQRLEPAQHAVAAPVLGQLDGGARHVAGIALELLLELLEQRHRVGGGAGEPGDDLAAADHAHLLRVRLHHGVADRDLPVAADGDLAVAPNGEDGRRADARERIVDMPKDSEGAYCPPVAALIWFKVSGEPTNSPSGYLRYCSIWL